MDNIEKINISEIRRKAIIEIKEKIKKNPKYLHPCNKERLEDMKRFEFYSGNEFVIWMQKNGIMRNPNSVLREYKESYAKRKGFENFNDLDREYRYNIGEFLPADLNEDCSLWFGNFTENAMVHYYPGVIKMPQHNHWFDYIWIKEGKEIKIDNKGRCLTYREIGNPNWKFGILWNRYADKFILSGWDNREDLNPIFAWEFDRDDKVRGKPFWKRDSFTITYTTKGLEQFKDHQIDISWLEDEIKKKNI